MVSEKVHSSDIYRLFLQAAMSRRVMNEAVAKALRKACIEAVARVHPTKEVEFVDGDVEWNKFLDKIKRMLDPLDLEIARFKDEDTGTVMYAITNTKGDEVAQLASDYNPTEIAFFKAIVEQIMLAPKRSFSVSSLSALRETSFLKTTMSKAQAEVILSSFVARGWLFKSKRGRYSLGARSILELSNYIRNTYDEYDVLECVACMEIVTKGFMCPTANCNAPLHRHCYELVRRRNLCPKCQQEWNEDSKGLIPIGEGAVTDDNKLERRRVRRTNGAEDGEADETSQQMTQTQTQSQTQSSQTQTQARKSRSKKSAQTKTNGKSKKRAVTPDSEEEDQLDSMFADDDDKDDDAIDIDNLNEIREKPSGRIRRH